MKKVILTPYDKERILVINSQISSVPKNIITETNKDVIDTLQKWHILNKCVRDQKWKIISYLVCQDIIENESTKKLHIKYVAADPQYKVALKQELQDLILQAKKLWYNAITFYWFNKLLNRFVSIIGFKEVSPLNGEKPWYYQYNLK